MKRNISCLLLLAILLGTAATLPLGAYVRVSYGADCLAEQAELIKTALRGDSFRFLETDFKQALGVSRIDSVTVLTLPPAADGTLKLKESAVLCGQVIRGGDIADLTFTPADDKMESTSFTFCANTSAGTTALTCTLRTADSINYAPSAGERGTSLYVKTQKGIAVYGEMSAEDPEGDALTYLVIAYPQRGTLTQLDSASGEFCYVPAAGATGEDSFVYVARDGYGNYSYPVTVKIAVSDRSTAQVYADLAGHPAHHAALVLAEKNILLGAIEGDGMYFYPDGEVSRGEFLVMAMKSAGIAPATGIGKTWFDDDAKIPASIKGYVATAQLYGYVNGSFDGSGLYFEADRAVTRAEAAVIMNNILNIASPSVRPVFADTSDIPVWARDSVYALHDAGILALTEGESVRASEPITRADAARALYGMLEYKKS